MATEPERPIEKLLRACANKRRDEAGAPLELHPATQRMLQHEVARQFGRDKRQPETVPPVWARLWPRFAWGAATFAVLVAVALVLVPGFNKDQTATRLALNEPVPEASSTGQFAPPAPAPTIAPSQTTVPADRPVFADSDRASTGRDQTARQLRPEPADRAKTHTAEIAAATAGEKMTPVTATPITESKKAAETMIAAADGTGQTPTGPAESERLSRRDTLAGSANRAVAAPVASASPAPIAAPVTASGGTAVATGELPKQSSASTTKHDFAYNAPATAVSPTRPPLSFSAHKDSLGAVAGTAGDSNRLGLNQSFAQVKKDTRTKSSLGDKGSPAQSVLVSFQVEQSGSELRIVDGDGSVYSGFVRIADRGERLPWVAGEKPAAARARNALEAKAEPRSAAAPDANGRAGQNYFFRVAGTNRSLNQKVVFTGNLMAATNLILVTQATNAWSGGNPVGGSQAAPAVQSPQPRLTSRISGKAVIGNRKEININAVPTGP